VAKNVSGLSASATSAATSAVIAARASSPVNTALPAISGVAQVGQTLTASNGTWTNGPTSYAYQWNSSGGGVIAGATAQTYVPVAVDVGHTLTVSVIATNTSGSSSPATSTPTSAVIPAGTSGTAARTADLLGILGVAAHAGDYAGLNGATNANIVSDAQYLGIRKGRDGFTDITPSSRELAIYQALYNVGISIIGLPWPTGDSVIANSINSAKLIAAFGPGVLFALEGPNEPAGFGFTYNGVAGGGGNSWASVAAWTRDWYAAVKADSTLDAILHDHPSWTSGWCAFGCRYGVRRRL
jgi:hypothetical protein